ncbi:MAG TPA: potassium transporter KtrA [Flavobacteriales bacterium]|jgi:trk system potassium uptake protein TrkA|nr:potassium transporter KtrA [Flavobacteriales bacterium]
MGVSKYAVIGLGHFGNEIARELAERGAQVLAIDNDESHIEKIKDDVAYSVTMDSTDRKALHTQGLSDMDAVVVAIGADFEALLLTTVYLMEMNVKRIIARANGLQQRKILEQMGVEEILSPEKEVAVNLAERLLNPSILNYLQLPDNYEIVEIKSPRRIIGRKIVDLDMRNKYKINLITIKREFIDTINGEECCETHTLGVPNSKTEIFESDTLVVFGQVKDIERFMEINWTFH